MPINSQPAKPQPTFAQVLAKYQQLSDIKCVDMLKQHVCALAATHSESAIAMYTCTLNGLQRRLAHLPNRSQLASLGEVLL